MPLSRRSRTPVPSIAAHVLTHPAAVHRCACILAPPDPRAPCAGNPLPEVQHLELREEQLRPGRLIVVGDVHGCCDELDALLNDDNT